MAKTDAKMILAGVIVGALIVGGVMYGAGFLGSTVSSITGGSSGGVQQAGATNNINVQAALSTVTLSAVEATTGATPAVNIELVNKDGTSKLGEGLVATPAATYASAAAPNSYDGYFMVGNDNFVSTTDRGAEVYYHKVPAVWSNTLFPTIPLITEYNETAPTWTGKDQGTVEATTNISVGATNENNDLTLKVAVTGTGALGNPDLDHPLAVCFNSTTYGSFDYIRPSSYYGTFAPPKFLKTRNIIGDCYILNTQALTSTVVDGSGSSSNPYYEFGVNIKPSAGFNPGDTESAYAFLLDKTYYKDDNKVWNLNGGLGYDSQLGTSTDVGFSAFGNEKLIAMS